MQEQLKLSEQSGSERKIIPQIDERPLFFPEDKPLISDYLYLTLEQMSPCVLMEADRVGSYKTRKVGFPGLACKHCVGQAGCGRYFPASQASLSQTTTSQTIMNHVRNCRRCPIEIRENLEIMKRARMGPDGKRADKPKHGGRKAFFHRLWCRIQGIPMEDEEKGSVVGEQSGSYRKTNVPAGTTFEKNFGKHGVFVGKVIGFKHPYYQIKYSDGEAEDLTPRQLLNLLPASERKLYI